MAHPLPRPLHVIDTDLLSNHTLREDTQRQLDDTRRRIAQLEHQELTLVAALDARARRFDDLLDERLTARTAAAPVGSTR